MHWQLHFADDAPFDVDERVVIEHIVALVIERVFAGRPVYGALDTRSDRRDLVAEALDEVIDAAFYLAAEQLRRQHHGGK